MTGPADLPVRELSACSVLSHVGVGVCHRISWSLCVQSRRGRACRYLHLFNTRVCHHMKCVGNLPRRHSECLCLHTRDLASLLLFRYMFSRLQMRRACRLVQDLLSDCAYHLCDHKNLPPDDMCRESATPALLWLYVIAHRRRCLHDIIHVIVATY